MILRTTSRALIKRNSASSFRFASFSSSNSPPPRTPALVVDNRSGEEGAEPLKRKRPSCYVIVEHNGVLLRLVKPYVYQFAFRFKQRGDKNRKLPKSADLQHVQTSVKQLFESQSGVEQLDAFQRWSLQTAIARGLIKVNGKLIENEDVVLRTGDVLQRVWHRHERPVLHAPLCIVEESENVLAVNKPPTIPVHPGGAYRLNSLKHLILFERPDLQGKMYSVHRLDRLTSGLILFAKSAHYAAHLSMYIQHRKGLSMRKTYLARVKGRFPSSSSETIHDVQPSRAFPDKYWVNVRFAVTGIFPRRGVGEEDEDPSAIGDDDKYKSATAGLRAVQQGENEEAKDSESRFMLLAYDVASDTSLVKCEPITGRTHQLRIHLREMGFPLANDGMYGGDASEEEAWALKHSDQFHMRCVEAISKPDDEAAELAVKEICVDCHQGKFEPVQHRGIFLHSLRIRLLSSKKRILDQEYRAPLPIWAAEAFPMLNEDEIWKDEADDQDWR